MTVTPNLLDHALIIAAQAHAGQRRKYVQTPYISHCLEVVKILIQHGIEDQVMLAAAALHDVLEDCDGWTPLEIKTCFYHYKYHPAAAAAVVALVVELTERVHQGNRATRKALECERLSRISPDAQTIKYADLISNTSSIVQHDPDFARVYLQEKFNILKVMRDGDYGLLDAALLSCNVAADRIGLVLT